MSEVLEAQIKEAVYMVGDLQQTEKDLQETVSMLEQMKAKLERKTSTPHGRYSLNDMGNAANDVRTALRRVSSLKQAWETQLRKLQEYKKREGAKTRAGPFVDPQQLEKARHLWSDVAKRAGWYTEPFYIQAWVDQSGNILDSVGIRGLKRDIILVRRR